MAGASITFGLFFLQFANEGINIHRNINVAVEYASAPVITLFGPANLWATAGSSGSASNVATEFRQLAIIYVLAIVVYQLFVKRPVDKMSAAAAALLICAAVGGLAPYYLFWPLVFIIASGRLRMASIYAIVASCFCSLFFLLDADHHVQGSGPNLGALLPLRSLHFLGLTHRTVSLLSSRITLDLWTPLANLLVPLAMCILGIYVLVSKRTVPSEEEVTEIAPLKLRSIRLAVPYLVTLLAVTISYGFISFRSPRELIHSIYVGVNHYAFVLPIYSWRHWSTAYYWTAKTPYRDVLYGNWWSSILVLGPLYIALWGYFTLRSDRTSKAQLNRPET